MKAKLKEEMRMQAMHEVDTRVLLYCFGWHSCRGNIKNNIELDQLFKTIIFASHNIHTSITTQLSYFVKFKKWNIFINREQN